MDDISASAERAAIHDAQVRARLEAERAANPASGTPLTPGTVPVGGEDVYHDAAHPAMTHTGTGDNRDETGDSVTGATVGGVGGALVGAAAGAALGPVGAAAGAVIGALTGAGAAGLAVDAVDRVDNDNTVLGVDDGTAEPTPSTPTAPIV